MRYGIRIINEEGRGARLGIDVKKLGTGTKKDFLYFFDEVGFADNKDWSGCYCQFYLEDFTDEEWEKRTPEGNREAAIRRIEDGEMKGFIAYQEGKPVGWCHANLKKEISAYREGAGSLDAIIACFVIAPGHRRQGIATMLLEDVVTQFREAGYESIEAHPVKGTDRTDFNYHGFLPMYERAGFRIVGESERYYTVRLDLQDGEVDLV
jgi:GNAT superfamily N-acetyltransferase